VSAALRARGVGVEIGGRRVLDDVSFEVERGEFACLCGPNGGGKTTFLKAALGLVPLAAGEIEVLGARPGSAGSAVGYVPQAKSFNPAFPARVVDVIVANRRGAWPLRVSPADREAARAAVRPSPTLSPPAGPADPPGASRSPPAGKGLRQTLLTRGRPWASRSEPVAIRMMSMSHQMPQPPNVRSFRIPSPTYPM